MQVPVKRLLRRFLPGFFLPQLPPQLRHIRSEHHASTNLCGLRKVSQVVDVLRVRWGTLVQVAFSFSRGKIGKIVLAVLLAPPELPGLIATVSPSDSCYGDTPGYLLPIRVRPRPACQACRTGLSGS